MTIMVITCLTIILDISCKVCCDEFFHVTAATTDNLYSLGFKDILGSLAHVAGKHNDDTHLAENWSYSALAPAALWRSHLADVCHLAINDIEYRIVCAMTEVVIHTSVSCWYRYLHLLIALAQSSVTVLVLLTATARTRLIWIQLLSNIIKRIRHLKDGCLLTGSSYL